MRRLRAARAAIAPRHIHFANETRAGKPDGKQRLQRARRQTRKAFLPAIDENQPGAIELHRVLNPLLFARGEQPRRHVAYYNQLISLMPDSKTYPSVEWKKGKLVKEVFTYGALLTKTIGGNLFGDYRRDIMRGLLEKQLIIPLLLISNRGSGIRSPKK